MEPEILEQAKGLHETVKLLRERVMRRHVAQAVHGEDGRCCFDLTMHQAHVMLAIREAGQVTIKELAHTLQVSAPSASTMVDLAIPTAASHTG